MRFVSILQLLKNARPTGVAATTLSEQTGISVDRVYQLIGDVRELGYQIESGRRGYSLCGVPDKLYPHELFDGLSAKSLVRHIVHFERIDSTNRAAMQKIAQGRNPVGWVFVSESQTRGRGRMGRSWISPKKSGIWMTLVLPGLARKNAHGFVNALVALAIAETLRREANIPAVVKWPNDVFVNGRKIAGVLSEIGQNPYCGTCLAVGMGVNYRLNLKKLPVELQSRATSITQEFNPFQNCSLPSRVSFAQALLLRIEQLWELYAQNQMGPIMRAWRLLAMDLGPWVRVSAGSEERQGRPRGINDNGALCLETQSGHVTEIYSCDHLEIVKKENREETTEFFLAD